MYIVKSLEALPTLNGRYLNIQLKQDLIEKDTQNTIVKFRKELNLKEMGFEVPFRVIFAVKDASNSPTSTDTNQATAK